MASVANDPGGRKRILFMAGDGRHKTIRLGKVSQRQAEAVRGHVEKLVAAALTRQAPDDETSRWVAALPDVMRKRLEAKGLVEARKPEPVPEPKPKPTLGDFLDGYLASRVDIKKTTRVALGQTVRYLKDFFGKEKLLGDITAGDADAWQVSLAGRGLAAATIRRRCGVAKQFGKVALRKGFLLSNPFADLRSANLANPARAFYVDRDTAQRVLDACPDSQWRLIFALCRYGGLRCPSEVLGLRWGDILWGQARFVIHSPKTARYAGHETRQVPLFPELLPHLQAAFDEALPGAEFVITRYRRSNANLATQLRRILWRAGIDPWPRLFTNLRASCDTDLAARFPAHVCSRWLGHTPQIAAKHYLQVTDADFEAAAAPVGCSSPTKSGAREGKTAQKAAQDQAVSGLPERERETADVEQKPVLPHDSESYTNLHINPVGATGLEPVTSWV